MTDYAFQVSDSIGEVCEFFCLQSTAINYAMQLANARKRPFMVYRKDQALFGTDANPADDWVEIFTAEYERDRR